MHTAPTSWISMRWRLALVVGGIAAVFIIDLLTPRGIDNLALYLLPIWYAGRLTWRHGIVAAAATATGLLIMGLLLSPEGASVITSMVNRSVVLFLIWVTAGALHLNRANLLKLGKAHDQLTQRTEELKKAKERLEGELQSRREVDAALQASEKRFRKLFDANMIALAFWREDGTVTDANDAWLSMIGYTREDLAAGNVNWRKATPPEYVHLDQKGAEELGATGICLPFEKEYVRKDGSRVPVLVGAASIDPTTGGAVTYVVDLTKLKTLEGQFRQAQKMEAVGQLAGGIAHDFNNLLTVILGNLQLLEEPLKNRPEESGLLNDATKAAWRGAELCQRILAFSRRQHLSPEGIAVNELLSGMEELLRRTLGGNAEVRLEMAPELMPVVVDRGQLENAILNLALNAHDAMPNGGTLSIRSAAFTADENFAAQRGDVKAGEFVVIEVSDTGQGMTPDVAARAFEPFFTTKETGKGSGLGLAMVYGFLKQSGGHVRIYSETGVGTSVKLYLPAAPPHTSTQRRRRPVQSGEVRGGSECILIVEDDANVRSVVTSMVSALGYAVLSVDSGAAGLEMLRQQGAQIDLLLSDVVMPGGMDGYELVKQGRALFPDLKAVLVSGFVRSHASNERPSAAGIVLLNKPFRRDELARILRQVLDA